ncbi:hypothetical protein ERO13_A05G285600v2 [Gossypium hirsutum]|uniref:Inactive protein RESTRICTED TEV MOVEMENT 2 n=3 Tax=Gossypium TaxID=3633 RepID=A0ABM3BMG1_GOSHI|nr:inactive protein RESTRICTED TEV MOVEMENT 2-like [Gossypium hirsutum]KAG4201571.1 hypothetical protein ERO13_A05G285600v2 [Gossypium hirsutum]TYI29423.1 hypothetical protein ES332_A05G315500v1 [Gossypium tomentosum]TYJ36444.1 hypothetical protein E1A91_A05G306800v1 [Gossypium mustelinum]
MNRGPRPNGIYVPPAPQQQPSQNFKPKSEWKHQQDASFLFIYLPAFAVDQLIITPDSSTATLKIEGKRRLPNNKTLPLDEVFNIPPELHLSKMEKLFGRGILTLKFPRISNDVSQQPSTNELLEETPNLPPETTADSVDKKMANDGKAAEPETTAMEETGSVRDESQEGKLEGDGKGKGVAKKAESNGSSANKVVEEKVKENKETRKEDDDKTMLVNMGLAVVIVVGLGVSMLYTFLGH